MPADYSLSDTVGLPDSYKAAIIDCVAALAELVDNEHVETQRFKELYNSFMQALGADFAQREAIDSEDGQIHEQQQRRRG